MRAPLQPKAKISLSTPSTSTPVRRGVLQRKCACGGTQGPTGECDACRKKRLQRKGVSRPVERPTQSVAPAIVGEVLRSSGEPLDLATRAFMEPRFGHDFASVRLHNDARAAESARAVNALAYTVGRDVVFGKGQFAPGETSGRRILAHELTHVIQQGASGGRLEVTAQSAAAGNPDTAHSRRVTDRATSGGSTIVIGQPATLCEQEAETAAEGVMNARQPNLGRGKAAFPSARRLLGPILQRRLVVNPTDAVPMAPGLTGPPTPLTIAVQGLLGDTCPDGHFQVSTSTGDVTAEFSTFCQNPLRAYLI
jgi:hypothetical protein